MADEYIRKQDAINALEEKEHEPWYLHKDLEWISGVVEAKDEIKSLEPADVAPVVRCRDCKHYYFADNRVPQEQRYVCDISGEIWKPDDFCSYGERREE